jgi:hypothetical protein
MSKKIIILALAAAGVAAFALPATAMAEDLPVHLVGFTLNKELSIDGGGEATLRSSVGTANCTASSGKAILTSTTTGTLSLTFTGCSAFGVPCHSSGQLGGTIVWTTLVFHLVTVEDRTTGATGPGLLVTPNVDAGGNNHFVTIECPPFGIFVVRGNGVIGTLTKPACGQESTEATIQFIPQAAAPTVQTHKTVVGTTVEYNLTVNGNESSLETEGTLTGNKAKLECT